MCLLSQTHQPQSHIRSDSIAQQFSPSTATQKASNTDTKSTIEMEPAMSLIMAIIPSTALVTSGVKVFSNHQLGNAAREFFFFILLRTADMLQKNS